MSLPSGPRQRAKQWLGSAVLLSVATSAAIALAEGVLRVAGFAPPPGLFTVSEAEFREIPGIFAPGQQVIEHQGTPFEHSITINSLGYRGADFTRSKPMGQLRVLFVGDSFTWGHNVDDDETTPAQLQRLLQDRCGDVVVANAGLSGSTILGHEALIIRGLSIDPDVVVLMYHENDLDELIYSRMWDQLAANRRAKSRFPVSVIYPVVRTSALWNLALDVRRGWQFRQQEDVGAGDPGAPPTGGDPGLVQMARGEYRERLSAVVDEVAQHDIPLLFATFPHPESVEAGLGGRDYDWVLELARDLGIAPLDLLGALREDELPVSATFLLPYDYHPSAQGHEIGARQVESRLVALDVVDRRCTRTATDGPRDRSSVGPGSPL